MNYEEFNYIDIENEYYVKKDENGLYIKIFYKEEEL